MSSQLWQYRRFRNSKSANSIKEGYEGVRKWTSKIDIFSKKYIIIPINEKYVVQTAMFFFFTTHLTSSY